MQAQTYKVGSDASAKPQTKTNQTPPPGQPLGWGSNIQNARLARAAELALKRAIMRLQLTMLNVLRRPPQTMRSYGFCLAMRPGSTPSLRLSVDAYNRGLRFNPSSLDGLSGLAQSYRIMGRTDEAGSAETVVAADPRRGNDVLLLGSST